MIMPTAIKQHALSTHNNSQSGARIDHELHAAFFEMSPTPRPCFSPALLQELQAFQQRIAHQVQIDLSQQGKSNIRYTVLTSTVPEIFNLGGDLSLFLDLIKKRDREALLNYAHTCIQIVHKMSLGLDLPVTTIALVQGSAQGGGFEVALSCNVIIAEEGVMMGFPEVLFNLFPGMGAYSFLRQRVNTALAEKIILSGNQYRAEELHEMGIVDILAKPGEGKNELREYIRHADRRPKINNLIRYTRREFNKVDYDELKKITELWVESALDLGEREFRTMERLIRFQNRKMNSMGITDNS